jgi:hypothetical protein
MAFVFVFVFFAACGDDPEPTDAMTQGRMYMQWFYENNTEKLWNHFSDEVKQSFGGSIEQFADAQEAFIAEAGPETEIIDEREIYFDPNAVYERAAWLEKAGKWRFYYFMDSSYLIHEIEISPLSEEAPTNYLDYETVTALRLPFEEEWVTLWGGKTTFDNYHAKEADQRFAYDFLVFKDGFYFKGNGSRNEDHYCFGLPVLAPGAGTVVASENNVFDNTPGVENWEQPLGNYLIIDHGNDEFSFLAHFKQGSLTVSVGDTVAAGQLIGQCGNSGGSDLPHLHYHLQNTQVPFEGEGLPAQFKSFFADGVFVQRGEPMRGERVQAEMDGLD